MIKKILIQLFIAILVSAHLIGCPMHTVQSDTQRQERAPVLSQEKMKPRQPDPPREMKSDAAESDSVDYQPAPVAQLQSALMGLESFRVFGYHFKIQKDQKMLRSLKIPTFEYIAGTIDPHLKLKKIKYDSTSEMYIASFLYMKAYLFWIHNDIDSARKTIAVLNRTFPQKHSDIMIYHFDKGNISLDDALYELEDLIGSKTESSSG